MWSLDLPQPVWLQASLGHITGLWSTFLGGEDRGASHYICQKETLLMMTSYKSHLFLVQKLENTYTESKRREMTIIPAPGDYHG